jgi:hypothetical protein
MSLGNEHKERLVNAFLRGQSVTDLSAFYAVTRTNVEDVLREAITQLATLAAGNVRNDTNEPAKEQQV